MVDVTSKSLWQLGLYAIDSALSEGVSIQGQGILRVAHHTMRRLLC